MDFGKNSVMLFFGWGGGVLRAVYLLVIFYVSMQVIE